MEAINNYNSGLNRHQLGGFIPVYDQLAGTHYFLIDGNRLGFMFICNPSPEFLIISKMFLLKCSKWISLQILSVKYL